MKNKNLNIRIPEKLRGEFYRIAEGNAQNPSALVRKWIENYVREEAAKMYIRLEDVTLIGDRSKLRDDDPIVYERIHRGERVLTLDNEHKPGAPEPIRYGRMYYDVNDQPCVVPDTQERYDKDVLSAKNSDQ